MSQRALTSSSPRGVLTLVSRRKPKPHHGGNHCRDDRNRGEQHNRLAHVSWSAPVARLCSVSRALVGWAEIDHHQVVKPRGLAGILGALPLAVLVVIAQATRQWSDWGCAGVGGSNLPPCVQPALWHWSDVDAWPVAIGAIVGAGIGLGIYALAKRERARRQLWGEA